MLFRPQSFTDFAARTPAVLAMAAVIEEVAAVARDELGSERLAWLSELAVRQVQAPLALVHASPDSPWLAPAPDAGDAEMERVYKPLSQPIAVYAHLHRSFVRGMGGMTVINTGSVSLSYDGDGRAAYLLLDDSRPEIRRVEYDVEQEIKDLNERTFPHADWIANAAKRRSTASLRSEGARPSWEMGGPAKREAGRGHRPARSGPVDGAAGWHRRPGAQVFDDLTG